MSTETASVRASAREVKALDRYRRMHRVTLMQLTAVHPRNCSWLSEALAGLRPMARSEVRAIRGCIDRIVGERNGAQAR